MKKMYFLLALASSLLAFTQPAVAQQEKLTSKTATKDNGYTVINAGEAITIYKYMHRSHSPKDAEKYSAKYFFITSGTDELQPLTKLNLERAFPNNHPFHDALDANFKEDKELTNYDDFHKMYKINRILQANTK